MRLYIFGGKSVCEQLLTRVGEGCARVLGAFELIHRQEGGGERRFMKGRKAMSLCGLYWLLRCGQRGLWHDESFTLGRSQKKRKEKKEWG